jgi:hypothetical protein
MEVKNIKSYGSWLDAKNACRISVNKENSKIEPTDKFKEKLIFSEHSPLRKIRISGDLIGVKSWVATHISRHNIGFLKFISSQREDILEDNDSLDFFLSRLQKIFTKYFKRFFTKRDSKPQGMLVNCHFDGNAQSYINISRARLCFNTHKETREAMNLILDAVGEVEPELVKFCVKECVYRNGICSEPFKSCGFNKSKTFKIEQEKYLKLIEELK